MRADWGVSTKDPRAMREIPTRQVQPSCARAAYSDTCYITCKGVVHVYAFKPGAHLKHKGAYSALERLVELSLPHVGLQHHDQRTHLNVECITIPRVD